MPDLAQPNHPAQSLITLVRQTFLESQASDEIEAVREKLLADEFIWRKSSDLNAVARRAALMPLEPVEREAILLRIDLMQDRLGHRESTLLERMLIEQVVTCWLHLELAQALYGAAALVDTDVDVARALERRLSGAQRRYLRALDALLRLRELGERPYLERLTDGRLSDWAKHKSERALAAEVALKARQAEGGDDLDDEDDDDDTGLPPERQFLRPIRFGAQAIGDETFDEFITRIKPEAGG